MNKGSKSSCTFKPFLLRSEQTFHLNSEIRLVVSQSLHKLHILVSGRKGFIAITLFYRLHSCKICQIFFRLNGCNRFFLKAFRQNRIHVFPCFWLLCCNYNFQAADVAALIIKTCADCSLLHSAKNAFFVISISRQSNALAYKERRPWFFQSRRRCVYCMEITYWTTAFFFCRRRQVSQADIRNPLRYLLITE